MGEVIVKRKVWIIVIIVLLVIIGGTWGYNQFFKKQHKEAQIATIGYYSDRSEGF